MLTFKSKVLVGALVAAGMASMAGVAMAGATSGNVIVSAALVDGCAVQAGTISFGNIVALAITGDQMANTGATFAVACSSGAVPTIASSGAHTMSDGATHSLPFNLSLISGAASDDMPSTTPSALSITKDGTMQTVTLYAKVLAANFTGVNALPAGSYSKSVVVDVAY